MPIPKTVKHADLVEAMKPLCDLLGTTVNNFYSIPGMHIADDRITFVVPVLHEEQAPAGRSRGTRVDKTDYVDPQGKDANELALVITVKVERP